MTLTNNIEAIDGKKAYMCDIQTSYKEKNLTKINFVFYFLQSIQKFCLFVVFIERLISLFIINSRGKRDCFEQFYNKTVLICCFFSLFRNFFT